MKTKFFILIILILGLAFVGWLVRGTRQVQPKFVGPVEELSIALTTNALSTLLWVADARGYFADYGLNVTLKKSESGLGTIKALFDGEVDLATTVEFVLASQLITRDDLRIIGSISTADLIDIIFRPDRVTDLSDLAGKKVGLVQASMSPFLLARTLLLEGIPYDAVNIVDMTPPQMEGALARGEVDAVVIWRPPSINIKDALGDDAVNVSSQAGQELHWLVFGFADWTETHPEVLERLFGALVEAEAFVKADEEATKDILAAAFDQDRSYIDRVVWPGHKFDINLPQSLIIALEDEGQWHIQNNPKLKGSTIPNYLDFIYFDTLDTVKPEVVTIIHKNQ